MSAETMRERAGQEAPSVAARTVVLVACGFVVFVAVALVGLDLYFGRAVQDAPRPRTTAFPEPRLQTDQHGDLLRLQARQGEAISGYAWVDRDQGLIRIPIDRAMALVAARGREALEPLDGPAVVPTPFVRGSAAP